MTERAALRRLGRQRRRDVPDAERARRAERLASAARRSVLQWRVQHIACFLSADGEIDTGPLIRAAWARGRTVWLPCLGAPHLRFRPYHPDTPLRSGDFGILEPAVGPLRPARALDLVLTPLVVFDAAGNRMGMGGGYYDRTFAFLGRRSHWRHPPLVGIAFEEQQVPAVPVASWDVPLDAVLTDRGFRRARRTAA